jgi:hypothetical protein
LAPWFGVVWVVASSPTAAAAQPWDKADGVEPASETIAQVAGWVVASGDNRGLPYMIIDKVAAQVFVFGADGQPKGATPALLGSARGDHSAPGVGDRELSSIRPEERTTPAGRFLAGYGPAIGRKSVLWVDYATAVSLHQVVTSNRKERRLQRLESATPEDNRITYGCINVAAGFYQDVVRPAFTGTNGVVYILPETEPLSEAFPSFQAQPSAASAR